MTGGKIILHVGHGKTGTSFLQSVFAKNQKLLQDFGINYPEVESFEYAARGSVTSGNGSLIFNQEFSIPPEGVTLLSDEHLFFKLSDTDKWKKFVERFNCSVQVILYVRDVIELLVSTWGQAVKRSGAICSCEEYIRRLDDPHYSKVMWWITASKKFNFDLRVENYSRQRAGLVTSFFNNILSKDSVSKIKMPRRTVVNRSLTPTEYEILRIMNSISTESSRFIADRLVESAPLVNIGAPRLSLESIELVTAHYKPLITEINAVIGDSDFLRIGAYEPYLADSSIEPMTEKQIEIVSTGVQNCLDEKVSHKAVDKIRDIALRMADSNEFSLSEALEVMKVANFHRPAGPFIRKKLNEWTRLVALKKGLP